MHVAAGMGLPLFAHAMGMQGFDALSIWGLFHAARLGAKQSPTRDQLVEVLNSNHGGHQKFLQQLF